MNILKLFRRHRLKHPEALRGVERLEIILSGAGGQGMVLAGRILAEAAALYEQKETAMTQSYGPEARGGASRVEIIISPERVDYPKAMHVDILLAMTQEALDKYGELLDPDGLLVVDETFIKKIPSRLKYVFKAPFSALALKLLDAPIVANIIALGALACITKVVSREALIQAVLSRVSEKALVLDRMAVDMGFKVVEDSRFRWNRLKL